MKLNYKRRLFLYLSVIFAIFTIGITIFEQERERRFRTEALENRLDAYIEIANLELLAHDNDNELAISNILRLLPQNIRLSIIDNEGNVTFDNSAENILLLQNHANRPEIVDALRKMKGRDIRLSASTNHKYIYYAKRFGNNIIRIAMPYDIQTKRFIKGDNLFIYFILAFFTLILIIINRITGTFSKSIKQLHDFVLSSNKQDFKTTDFPKDELGEIGAKITKNYLKLKESKRTIDVEREKLLQHIHSSEEGVCFFSENKTVQFYNGLFIQYLNTLTNEPQSEPYAIFSDKTFSDVNQFLSSREENYYDTQISKQGKTFSLRVNIFEDNSFEIVLNDISKREKTRQLKQEMTGNIAHELRTPVTSIRGYLETILEQPLSEEKKQYFTKQAFEQTITLSELIQDMSLITKIEEAPLSFRLESVNINHLLQTLKEDFSISLKEKEIELQWNVSANISITGNRNLLYSIFRNLIDNSIRYAGEHISIFINLYKEDKDFLYFSFYDTGTGILDESHLTRLFERFYRINEGRTRSTGGSGLGLSIVRNAIAFHRGSIIAKNRAEGGLEFLFHLHR